MASSALRTILRQFESADLLRPNELFLHLSVPVDEYRRQILLRVVGYADVGDTSQELRGRKLLRQLAQEVVDELTQRHSGKGESNSVRY